jgi:hypothetical protein
MATGIKTFDSRGITVPKFTGSQPFAAGEYDLKLETDSIAIGKKDEPGKFPYINCRFRALGTAGDSGKDRVVFHMFFTSLKPSEKGFVLVHRGDQLVEFARALGMELTDAKVGIKELADENGEMQDYLDPQALVKWLKSNDGAVLKGRVKIRKDKEYGDKNVVDFFIPGEVAEAEYEAEEEVEEEPAPAPAPAKKTRR